MKNIFDVIQAPSLNEKSTLLQEQQNQVVLRVHPQANKLEIKQAVEELFKVKVAAVRTAALPGKRKRAGAKSVGFTSSWKKAYITLSEGKIDFLADL